MKYLFVLLLVGIVVSAFGQSQKEQIAPMCDKVDGLQIADESLVPSDYTGVVKQCKDGKVQKWRNYKDGKKDGLYKSWYQNGQLELERNYKDGDLISQKCYDEDGNEIKCKH